MKPPNEEPFSTSDHDNRSKEKGKQELQEGVRITYSRYAKSLIP